MIYILSSPCRESEIDLSTNVQGGNSLAIVGDNDTPAES